MREIIDEKDLLVVIIIFFPSIQLGFKNVSSEFNMQVTAYLYLEFRSEFLSHTHTHTHRTHTHTSQTRLTEFSIGF